MMTHTTDARRLLQRKLDSLLRTGQILLESSADTSRIMRNMKRAAAYLGLPEKNLHIHIDYNMLMVNIHNTELSFSKFQRCDKHGINFTAISAVSKLTYRAANENYSLAQYEAALDEIANRERNYSPLLTAVGAAFACGGFCIQFGCDWVAFLYATLAAFLGFRLRYRLIEFGLNIYMAIACAAFASTVVAWLTTYLPASWTSTPLHPLLACALFIVPGVPLINFVDDMLDNNIQTGLVRAANTMMMMIAMAFGILFALKFCLWAFNFQPDIMGISMVPHHNYWEYAIAAAISGMGFSMIFNIPKRLLWVAAVGAAIAVCTRNLVSLQPDELCQFSLGWGGVLGSLAASVLISLIMLRMAHRVHAPMQILAICSVIPMVPGVLMYRSLYSFLMMTRTETQLVDMMSLAGINGINASLMIFCIALGVAVPSVFAKRYIGAKKQQRFFETLKAQRREDKSFDWEQF